MLNLLPNASHIYFSVRPRVAQSVLLPLFRHLQPLVSCTKAVALNGTESDPSLILCYCVATFGGENTGDNAMGAAFYCLPTLFAAIPGDQTLSEYLKNKGT